jgi:hypothetical protein
VIARTVGFLGGAGTARYCCRMRVMSTSLALLLVTTACTKADDDFAVEPGGGGGRGSNAGHVDGGTDSTLGGSPFAVCLVTDLRGGSPCAATGAGGLTVTLGGTIATTADDGTFTLTPPGGSALTWMVTGTTTGGTPIVTSVQQFGTLAVLFAISQTSFMTLLGPAASEEALFTGTGSIVIMATRAGTFESGVTASETPALGSDVFVDAPDNGWDQTETATGSAGTIWMVNVPTPALSVTLTPTAGSDLTPLTLASLPVIDQAITFALVDMP